MAAHTHQSDGDIFSAARKALDECLAVSPGVCVHVDHGTVTLTGGSGGPWSGAPRKMSFGRLAASGES